MSDKMSKSFEEMSEFELLLARDLQTTKIDGAQAKMQALQAQAKLDKVLIEQINEALKKFEEVDEKKTGSELVKGDNTKK